MTRLSVDYAGLVRGLRMPLAPADLGAALLDAVAERYEHQFPVCSLLQFVQSGATYLFDLASAVGAGQEDRTLAAWTTTPATVGELVILRRGHRHQSHRCQAGPWVQGAEQHSGRVRQHVRDRQVRRTPGLRARRGGLQVPAQCRGSGKGHATRLLTPARRVTGTSGTGIRRLGQDMATTRGCQPSLTARTTLPIFCCVST